LDADIHPTFADIDGDGDVDAFVGSEYYGVVKYFENISDDSSIPEFRTPYVDIGALAAPTFVDLDSDGDLDIFAGGRYNDVVYFENTGDSTNPTYPIANREQPFGIESYGEFLVPCFTDIDNDGDMDLFIGDYYGNLKYYENTGDSANPNFSTPTFNPFGLTTASYHATPTFVDMDADGDQDLFVGEDYGNTFYFENTGSASMPSFAAPITNPFGIENVGYISISSFADLDEDGDFDVFASEYFGTITYFENQGTSTEPEFVLTSTGLPFGFENVVDRPILSILDLNGDGISEAVLGGTQGRLLYFENEGAVSTQTTVAGSQLDIFPIPTENVLNYKVAQVKGATAIHLFDVLGKLVKTDRVLDGTLDLSDLPSGQYTLVVEGAAQRIHRLIQKI
jgi:hypothetical protein